MKFGKITLCLTVLFIGFYWIATLDKTGTPDPLSEKASSSEIEKILSHLAPSLRIEGRQVIYSNLKERMAHYKTPAVSIAYMENYKIKWTVAEGVIDIISKRPIDENTVFQAASISKPTFATVLMKYRELNGLDLDAPVNSLLKSWQLPPHEWTEATPVTLRRLLSHSAGTTVHGFAGYPQGEPIPDILGVLNGNGVANSDPVIVDFEPSTKFRYSGGGTTIAQLTLQDQSGLTLTELAKELLFGPLGMDHSGYLQPLTGPLIQNAAQPHKDDGNLVEGGAHTYATLAAAGLWTTPSDLMRLASSIQQSLKGEIGNGLSQSSAIEMLTVQQQTPVGIGFLLEGNPVTAFKHGGSNAGFRAQIFAHKDKGTGIAVMTNSDRGSELIQEIIASVSEVMNWEEGRARVKKIITLTPPQSDALVGIYHVTGPIDATLVITSTEDALMVNIDGIVKDHVFFPESADTFFAMDGTPLKFELNDEGQVKRLTIAGVLNGTKVNN